MVTTIQLQDETWTSLNRLKLRGETFDDVINNLIKKENQIKLKKEVDKHGKTNKLADVEDQE